MVKRKNKKRRRLLLLLLLAFVVVTIVQNFSIVLTEYEVQTDKLAPGVELNIVQLSDVHFISDAKQANRLLELTVEAQPHIIAITGDLIDTPKYTEQMNENAANGTDNPIGQETIDFCEALVKIAPCYFIYGNHEMSLLDDPENNEFMLALEAVGVKIINNEALTLGFGDEKIHLLGVQDPSTLYKDPVYAHKELENKGKVQVILDDLFQEIDSSNYTLVLSHRPEYFDLYTTYSMDLLLAGHAHGGQFRLPFVKEGLVAPGQGLFPSYTTGEYKSGDFTMIVSRGIGNSIIPVRIFNTPEVVKITVRGK